MDTKTALGGGLKTQSLNGQWTVSNQSRDITIPATVPGDVYADLLDAGEIPDPFYRDNELKLQWIGESDWNYTREFTVAQQVLSKERILLRCEGLDTFARVMINGQVVAETDNMFRTYEWDIRELLKPGRNSIRVGFTSVLPYIRKQHDKFPEWKHAGPVAAYPGWVRKEQCNFGWDWGIKAVTCGIWRDICIVAFDEGRVGDICFHQRHTENRVDLGVEVSTEGAGRGTGIDLSVRDGNHVVAAAATDITRGKAKLDLSVNDPKLWWPNTMGEQHLYTVRVELKNAGGRVVDSVERRIGLRTLELDRHDDEWGESFQFVVNGVPFFAKGANWIPADAILARMTPERYRCLIQDAAAANMNMLRVWGGGIYEDDSFYDACDELGIWVWQDFMFACAAYPIFDPSFLANVEAEARDAITRLRHHPCLALWCGNNELEMMNVGDDGWETGTMPWKDYKVLFDKLLPKQVAELSPDIAYWPSSPHTPKGDRRKHRSHLCGDAHLWIMSGRYPMACAHGFEHRFASEFGFQSFPEPKTISTFTVADDRDIPSRIMELHQRAPNGNTTIIEQLLRCFRMPVGFENTVYASQILAGAGVKSACEHFRRSMPRAMGALYWQLNDCWPVASWSSIDFHGRWKAMHYMAREFFAPVLVTGLEDCEKGTVEIHVTSDRLAAQPGTVSWVVTNAAGKRLLVGEERFRTPVNGNRRIGTLCLRDLVNEYGHADLLVWLEADVEGEPPQHNVVFLAPPKQLELDRQPEITYTAEAHADGTFTITLRSKKVALWVWLELLGVDARLSDNFFHLRPDLERIVSVEPEQWLSLQTMRQKLKIRSLIDTYS